MGWTVRGSNPGGATFSAPVLTDPGAHPASCTMGTGSFPGVKSSWGDTLTPHPLLVPWSWKGRAIPLLPLWAVRPVQSLSAYTRGALYLLPYTWSRQSTVGILSLENQWLCENLPQQHQNILCVVHWTLSAVYVPPLLTQECESWELSGNLPTPNVGKLKIIV